MKWSDSMTWDNRQQKEKKDEQNKHESLLDKCSIKSFAKVLQERQFVGKFFEKFTVICDVTREMIWFEEFLWKTWLRSLVN